MQFAATALEFTCRNIGWFSYTHFRGVLCTKSWELRWLPEVSIGYISGLLVLGVLNESSSIEHQSRTSMITRCCQWPSFT